MGFDPDAYLRSGSSVSSSFDPDAYLGIEKKKPTYAEALKLVPKMLPVALEDTVKRIGPSTLPILGGAAGAPFGLAAPGAALGQFAKNAINTVANPQEVPKTPLGNFADVVGAGIMQEPKILKAIPGVSQVADKVGSVVGNSMSKVGTGIAKLMEATTGGKANQFIQAAKQGLSTYGAPTMEKAQQIFGEAAESAGAGGRPPLKQVIDPALQTARKVALDIGGKLEKGADISAGEALQARQAIDRIYNATNLRDRATRGHLAELRTAFDGVMTGKSGALKEASTLYRKAIVKDTLLNPFKITKQGQISAVAPMVATLAASAGLGSGHKEGTGIGALGYLAASSPLMAGLAATTGGSATRGLMKLGENPAIRQALLQTLEKITRNKK